ncbi:hypothetical protein D0T66_12925 [Dysgonomonas sp. 25]|nr:hypothetical protein [Dysgonomonas sp. 25]
MLGTLVAVYVIGLVEAIKSFRQYKYHLGWLVLAFGLLFYPVFIFALYPAAEYSILKKRKSDEQTLRKAKQKRLKGILFALWFVFSYTLMSLYFKYVVGIEWSGELAFVCINIVTVLLLLGAFILSYKNNTSSIE